MNWKIENKSHIDKGISDYIGEIFSLTLQHVSESLSFDPPLGIKPIHLRYDCHSGPIVYLPLSYDKYEIGICVNGIFPHQIVFQMAHELCHIYIDARMNGVFIEIMCQKTAIDILEEIGAPLTSGGHTAVEEYISDLKSTAESMKSLKLVDIKNETLFERIKDLEDKKILVDREINNLIAFKIKEMTDRIDKFGIIKHIRNSITPSPPNSPSDLTAYGICKIIPETLLENIASENPELSKSIRSMLQE
jgi:hypothetical protein